MEYVGYLRMFGVGHGAPIQTCSDIASVQIVALQEPHISDTSVLEACPWPVPF